MRVSKRLTEIRLRIGQWWAISGNAESRRLQADTAESVSASSETETSSVGRASPARATDEVRKTGDCPETDIFALLTEHGGMIRQEDVVSQTRWSKSTISRHLTKMEENGRVKRIPLNHSKLVLLPEKDLADFTKLSHGLR